MRQLLQDKRELEDAKKELDEMLMSGQEVSQKIITAKDAEIAQLQHRVDKAQLLYERRIIQLENRIDSHAEIRRLHDMALENPYREATSDDFKVLNSFMNDLIPAFYPTFHTPLCSLREIEYRVCVLIRFHFKPSEIARLNGTSNAYIANLKKRILMKVYGIDGIPKDLDQRIQDIK